MKTCRYCSTTNPDGHKFCQQCGRPLEATAASGPVEDATVRWTGQPLNLQASLRQHLAVAALFGDKDRLVIGRGADCDLCLPHPMVSRYHALLERRPEGLRLRDLASVNGVWVGGKRISEPITLREGEQVGIGPFLFTLRGGVIQSLDSSRSLRLEARRLEKVVLQPDGKPRKLLDNINLVINPGEFVSLLGPSGSGKSTLMDCLNGRRRATGGQVLANGVDFYRHFDNFRTSLGYVPQRDIVHTQLTVARALYYTAQLRLPLDTEPGELQGRMEAVLREMELVEHRNTLVANLSGGQIKRVSLGAELLAQPCLLFIDEATSGLDAGTEATMMRLFRRLADEGRSLICITHNVDNVDQCHLALVLAQGRLLYFGPPREAVVYFKVSRISDIYDQLKKKPPEQWEKEYCATSLYQEYVRSRLESGSSSQIAALPGKESLAGASGLDAPPHPPDAPARGMSQPDALARDSLSGKSGSLARLPMLVEQVRALTGRALRLREFLTPLEDAWHQFRVLTARYVELILGDPRGLRLLLLQAPIVALFLLVGFADKQYQSEVTWVRPLDEHERQTLLALQAVGNLLDPGRQPDETQLDQLKKAGLEVNIAGNQLTLNGADVVPVLRLLHRLPLPIDQKKILESISLKIRDGDETKTLTAADLVQVFQRLQQSHMLDFLLKDPNEAVVPDPEHKLINPRYTYMLLFILVMVVLWFGCNNAAKEIVKEEAIYGRERAVNLGIVPYLASKFLVLTLITAGHALILQVTVLGTLYGLHLWDPQQFSVPSQMHILSPLVLYGVLVLLSMAGVALGLLLSACVSTPDRANALLPYVLIPQMILGGGILSVGHGLLYYLAVVLSPVYWAYRAVHLGASSLPPQFPAYADYPDGLGLPCQALVIQTVVLLLLTASFLRTKDA